MRDILVTIHPDGSAVVEQPAVYTEEHNSARLVIFLNEELAHPENDYLCLCFDLYGLNQKILSNHVHGEPSDKPAYRIEDTLYCPLPSSLTGTGALSVQVEAHSQTGAELTRVTKSAVFQLQFAPSVTGSSAALEEACGFLPQLQAAVDKLLRLEGWTEGPPGSWTENPPVIEANPKLDATGAKGDIIPSHLTVGSRDAIHAIGSGSLAVGQGTAAAGKNSCAIGSAVKTAADNALVVGVNAEAPADALFTVGNGYSPEAPSSALHVTRTRVYAEVPLYSVSPSLTDNSNMVATTSFVRNNLHSHSNKTVLDLLSENSGVLTYNGAAIGGGSGTSDYTQLTNKPSINGVTLSGNKTNADLGISAGTDGATFTPSVSGQGVISWTNDKSLNNPASVSIMGPQGQKGDTGNTGSQGPKGDIGNTGAQGPKGDTGNAGAQGPKGDTGNAGAQGPKGDTGNTGAQGPKGDTGNTGSQGPAGQGVPTGGTAGQALVKLDSTNYNTGWANIPQSDDIKKLCRLTQAQYNALSPKEPQALYCIIG